MTNVINYTHVSVRILKCSLSTFLVSSPLLARENRAANKTDTVLGSEKIEVWGIRISYE